MFLVTAAVVFATVGLGVVYVILEAIGLYTLAFILVFWAVIPAGIASIGLAIYTVWLAFGLEAKYPLRGTRAPPSG